MALISGIHAVSPLFCHGSSLCFDMWVSVLFHVWSENQSDRVNDKGEGVCSLHWRSPGRMHLELFWGTTEGSSVGAREEGVCCVVQ
ncbi:hypothetical protein KDH_26800 [Dictyobacter sp. S3.2.2.5]|uniref:Secreted protein n=1 Tax=Dictyobacter halimunensis TaxID=3026934 RepID=A0ABQ6FSQ8_9CHLR|nr:hypothetical protein KDH_26800 [Dictyobacter sp. S3.2.2.5]